MRVSREHYLIAPRFPSQVGVYKVVRTIAGIAVNQVKDFTATLPKVVLEGAAKADAEAAKAQLLEAGAKASVK
jgi:large subunit ribosomal protein L7/L12